MSTTTAIRWISTAKARGILGIGEAALQKVIDAGLLTVRRVPGARPRFLLDEVRALAERSTRPAWDAEAAGTEAA